MDDQTTDIGRLCTLAEAANLTGLSVDALRHRVKQWKLQSISGYDGVIRVWLDEATMRAGQTPANVDSAPHGWLPRHGQPNGEMASQLASLREQLAVADTLLLELRDRLARAEQDRDAISECPSKIMLSLGNQL